jgi:hypothetical protein
MADGLARESAGENIDAWEVVTSAVSNVSEPLNVGPVLGEDSSAPLIDLYLPCDLHSRPLKPEVYSPDPRE